ncbi:diguanylate cyclase [Solitalea longa]|uniref:Diguanylate cyclase n=1 Tax=Solitalea longa TaxID=2079460 RepID=A0A2S4ZX20_9SPHI|nr:GAF domain-containing protein [Solitalea longa]POY34855.1 diguanylate cyclase [Solitalea longa]
MAEELKIIAEADKKQQYESLIPQLKELLKGEDDLIANLANTAAALKQTFDFFWVGFYLVKDQELVLGPFQGSIACTRIGYGKGVCGSSWKQQEIIIVDNVDEYPGHIACSSLSKSEIVVPVLKNGIVVAVLDIDSDELAQFDETDAHFLEQIVTLLKF